MSTSGHERDARVLALALARYDTDAIARQLGLLRRVVERALGRLRRLGSLPHSWRPTRGTDPH